MSYRALYGTRTSQQLIWEWNPGVLFNFHVPSSSQHHHPNSFSLQLYLILAMLGKCNFCARFRRRASCLTWTCQVLKHCFILLLWVRICLLHLSVPATKMITVTNLSARVCCWKIWSLKRWKMWFWMEKNIQLIWQIKLRWRFFLNPLMKVFECHLLSKECLVGVHIQKHYFGVT